MLDRQQHLTRRTGEAQFDNGELRFFEAHQLLDTAMTDTTDADKRRQLTTEAGQLFRHAEQQALETDNLPLALRIETTLPFLPLMAEFPPSSRPPSPAELRHLSARINLGEVLHHLSLVIADTLRLRELARDRHRENLQELQPLRDEGLGLGDTEFKSLFADIIARRNASPLGEYIGLLNEQTFLALMLFEGSLKQFALPSLYYDDALGPRQLRSDSTFIDNRPKNHLGLPVAHMTGVQIKTSDNPDTSAHYDHSVIRVITAPDIGNRPWPHWTGAAKREDGNSFQTARALVDYAIHGHCDPTTKNTLLRIRQGLLTKIETLPAPVDREAPTTRVLGGTALRQPA